MFYVLTEFFRELCSRYQVGTLKQRLQISGNTESSCSSAHSDLPPAPLLYLHYPLLFGHHRACLGTKTKDGPRYLALSVAWIEGWGTMFGCFNAALIPLPPPLLISACNNTILFRNLPHPHPTQFSTAKTPNSTPVSGMQSPPPRIPQIPSKNFFLPPPLPPSQCGWSWNVPPARNCKLNKFPAKYVTWVLAENNLAADKRKWALIHIWRAGFKPRLFGLCISLASDR